LSPPDPFSAIYCGIAAYAQFIEQNYEAAIQLAREAIRQRTHLSQGCKLRKPRSCRQ
jgi:hypothetical protein